MHVLKEGESDGCYQGQRVSTTIEPVSTDCEHREKVAPSRRVKNNISGYFSPEVHRQLRVIAAEEDKNLQEILGDALNALFELRGKPPIA